LSCSVSRRRTGIELGASTCRHVKILTLSDHDRAQNVEIREPGAKRPAIRVERMDLKGIDFD
jgi:hypothetical protein